MNPNAAARILDAFGVDGALTGDLVQRRERVSWPQIASAISNMLVSDARRNPAAVIGVAVAAFLYRIALAALATTVEPRLDLFLGTAIRAHVDIGRLLLIFIVAVLDALLTLPLWTAIGWSLARFGRPRLVLLFLLASWILLLPGEARQVTHAVTDPAFREWVVLGTFIVWNAAAAFGTLAGVFVDGTLTRRIRRP